MTRQGIPGHAKGENCSMESLLPTITQDNSIGRGLEKFAVQVQVPSRQKELNSPIDWQKRGHLQEMESLASQTRYPQLWNTINASLANVFWGLFLALFWEVSFLHPFFD